MGQSAILSSIFRAWLLERSWKDKVEDLTEMQRDILFLSQPGAGDIQSFGDIQSNPQTKPEPSNYLLTEKFIS